MKCVYIYMCVDCPKLKTIGTGRPCLDFPMLCGQVQGIPLACSASVDRMEVLTGKQVPANCVMAFFGSQMQSIVATTP